ncbi:hypothetical protein HPB50_010540 [Hyalomma asiaticum]|uniref:Uncharacterized protein n=1 Tax=Hyalomma asiaticum TaxID=266040 RepID=A0ACB7T9V8_HYAAI|nr:hypothetical protein HPB50_010540 [Hyalomma asiaticum]
MRLASQTADFLWGNVVVRLPRRGRLIPGQGQEVTVLGDAVIPENVASLLKLGPKFCEHPDLDNNELLGVVRTTAGRASTDGVDRCIREGVDCLPQRVKKGNTARQRTTVAVLREAGLKLLVSDKEGGFVVMPSGLYKDKADAAILNNFKELQGVPPAKGNQDGLGPSVVELTVVVAAGLRLESRLPVRPYLGAFLPVWDYPELRR